MCARPPSLSSAGERDLRHGNDAGRIGSAFIAARSKELRALSPWPTDRGIGAAVDLLILPPVFGIVFVGELPDKPAVASLVLGARYSPPRVLLGVWAAFAVHVVVACVAGGFVAELPRTPVEVLTSVLFVVGAVLLLRSDPDRAA